MNFNSETFQLLLNQLVYQADAPLVFNSSFFLFFFTFFFSGYALLYNKTTWRLSWVVLFSLYFFYKACGYYVGLILLASVVDFYISHWIDQSKNTKKKKGLLIFSIVLNLGLLFYFKYTDFFIQLWNQWGDHQVSFLYLILPVGISFYTFENLSYTVDVYRGHFKPVKKWLDYIFFLSFFPKLMMGPIVRAADFLPQIRQHWDLKKDDIAFGFFYIFSGCFKKVVISDYLYNQIVSVVFDDPTRYNGVYNLTAVYAYALVIYCDFSGYSDMAIGIARWMGLKIDTNFLAPYQSKSITEFWRRWHISLSSWLRDYLYIPLGGNRKGLFRTYVHLFITMLLGGFWHGANWTFIIWGALHGGALAIDKCRLDFFKKRNIHFQLPAAISIFLTFHFVVFCWIFFGPDSLEKSTIVLKQIVFNFDLSTIMVFMTHYQPVLWMIAAAVMLHQLPLSWNDKIIDWLSRQNQWFYVFLGMSMFMVFAYYKSDTIIPPIYLQF
jgi:D-alanyl-lipoteichoic acid acyltransferase DltB (MBOAT superfamily)